MRRSLLSPQWRFPSVKPKLPAPEDFTVSVLLKVLEEAQEEANDVPVSKRLSKPGLSAGRVRVVEDTSQWVADPAATLR